MVIETKTTWGKWQLDESKVMSVLTIEGPGGRIFSIPVISLKDESQLKKWVGISAGVWWITTEDLFDLRQVARDLNA